MPTPNKETVERVLAKNNRAALIRDAVEAAWTKVLSYPDLVWFRRKTTRAALVWEYAVENAIAALSVDKGVGVARHHDTVSFVFDDAVLVRFKKANIELRSSNYPTELALLYHEHKVEDLFGLGELQRVEAAYVLNRFQNRIMWVGIVARKKKRALWDFELAPVAGAEIVELLPRTEPAAPAAERVIQPRATPDEKSSEEGE